MRRILAVISLAAAVVPPGAATVSPIDTHRVQIVANDEADIALVHSALSRFDEAGLVLPELTVEFLGPSLEPCGGSQAKARLSRNPITISVCWGTPFVLLHELAHIWEATSVSENARAQFIDLRDGVRSWADPSDAWKDQGREHAANVVAWGLSDNPPVVGRTYPNDRVSLTEAFVTLTGRSPLHHEGGEPASIDRSVLPQERDSARASGK